jgi:hypothetical protein
MSLPTLSRLALAAALLVAAGCGGSESGGATTVPKTDSTVSETSAAPSTEASAPVDTVASTTVAPTTVAPAPTDPWSDNAATDLAAVLAAADGSGDAAEVMERLFGNPIAAPLPADAALTTATVKAERVDGTWEISWQFAVASALSAADLEVAVAQGFNDDRFEVGVRVESTLDSGVFVTQNYPATAEADADGWSTLAITVGPETDFGTATGRNEVEVSIERTLAADDPQLAWFVQGWLAEMPVADGLELIEVTGDLVALSTTGVWLSAVYAPVDDTATFEGLVEFYSQEFIDGALSIDASTPPTDLSATDRFNAGFFPTLAGYDLFLVVTRDLADPSVAPTVSMEVRMEP